MNISKILRVITITIFGMFFFPSALFSQVLSVEASATPQISCSQTAVQLHAEPSGGTGNYTYTWVGNPGNFNSYLQNPTAFPYTTTNFTVFVNDGVTTVSDIVTVQVVPNPVADAGDDATICENTSAYTLVGATASNFSYAEWSTEGDGHFNSSSMINPTYYPGTEDVENGNVRLTLHAVATAPCTGEDFDQMILNISPFPTVEVGEDVEVCENQVVTLSATASNYSSLVWTSNSVDGYFSSYNSLNTEYHLGESDINQGDVVLTLEAYSESPCPGSVIDNLVVNITDLPTVDAGDDGEICEGNNYSLSGTASGYSSVLWTTSGSGNFQNPNQLSAVYLPSDNDINSGEVTLTLTVTGQGECSQAVNDDITLAIHQQPFVNAGDDEVICENSDILLSPVVNNTSGVLWSTSGDGTFDDNTLEDATYTPGENDLVNGSVLLTVIGQPITPCNNAVDDVIEITFSPLPVVNAGDDDNTCDNSPYNLTATVQNYSSVLWTTSGDGVFDDATSITAIYTPGAEDASTGEVQLTIVAQPEQPCSDVVTDFITLSFIPGPFVNVGDDIEACEDELVNLSASVLYSTANLWTTSGDGNFDDATLVNAHYTFGDGDIETGSVVLTMTATNDDCGNTSDDLLVTIQNSPTAFAGDDTALCGDLEIQLQGEAENYGSLEWHSQDPNGSFSDANILNPVYTLGPEDIANNHAVLTFTANALLPCQNPVTDEIEVDFYLAPTVSAGNDGSVCEGDTIFLNAVVSNTNTVYWFHHPSSVSSGTFEHQDLPETWYVPSSYDYEQGSVELHIEGTGMGTCGIERDTIFYNIDRMPEVHAGEDMAICRDGVADLEGESQFDAGIQWDKYYTCDGTFGDQSSLSTTYTPGPGDIATGYATLVLSGWASGECNEPGRDTLILTINDYPTVSVGEDISICSSEKVNLSPVVDNFSALHWTTSGNGVFSDPTAIETEYTIGTEDVANGSVILTLKASPNYPCSGEVSDQMFVTVKEAPVIDMPNLVFDDFNNAITFTPEVTGASGVYTFAWSPEDAFVNAAVKDATTIEFSPEGDTTYHFDFTVTDNVSGCSTIDTLRLYLGVGDVRINLQADPDYVCSGGSTTLYPNASGGMGTYTYYWTSTPAGFSSTSPNPVVSPTQRTTYTVIVSDNNTSPSASVDIEVMPTPTTPNIEGPTGVVSQSHEIYYVSDELNSYFNWWAINGSVIDGQGTASSTIEWGVPGIARVFVCKANEYGCFGDTTQYSVNIGTNGIEEYLGINNLNIYPNPFDKDITVSFDLSQESDVEISVVNMMGKEIASIEDSHQKAGEKRYTTAIPEGSAGVYFIRIRRDKLQAMYRVVRVK